MRNELKDGQKARGFTRLRFKSKMNQPKVAQLKLRTRDAIPDVRTSSARAGPNVMPGEVSWDMGAQAGIIGCHQLERWRELLERSGLQISRSKDAVQPIGVAQVLVGLAGCRGNRRWQSSRTFNTTRRERDGVLREVPRLRQSLAKNLMFVGVVAFYDTPDDEVTGATSDRRPAGNIRSSGMR